MLLYSNTLSPFQVSQSLLLLLNAVCLARSNKYQFNSHWFGKVELLIKFGDFNKISL